MIQAARPRGRSMDGQHSIVHLLGRQHLVKRRVLLSDSTGTLRKVASCGEEHAESVVVAVAEPACEAAVELDDPVHSLGAAVR